MSTSPSWFDQEKFSRLVKKVGPKTPPAPIPAPESAPAQQAPPPVPSDDPENPQPGLASTARISLVSRPPSLMSEQRALPALPRRTAPLPAMKSLFESAAKPPSTEPREEPIRAPATSEPPTSESSTPAPAMRAPPLPLPPIPIDDPNAPPIRATGPLPQPKDKSEDIRNEAPPETNPPTPAPVPEGEVSADDIESIWHKMALLNEELAHAIHERDQAVADANVLREQLRASDDALEGSKDAEATREEFARLIRERDDAMAQAQSLRAQLDVIKPSTPPTFGKPPEGLTKTKELTLLTGERDQARQQYAELRKQYEALKQGAATGPLPAPKEESSKIRKELEQQLEGFRVKLEEKNREIALLKAGGTGGGSGDDNPLLQEANSLREQLTKAKEEASVAQRGLALSQKALHETRDTLREATEGTSLSRHNFDNLKSECAALTQQNTMLQSQNEQLTRELAAAKSKLTTRS